MEHKARNFEELLGMEGFSDPLLRNHFKLYEGYVAQANALFERLKEEAKKPKLDATAFSELKRRLGWEWNGVRLHELYFEGMRKGGRPPSEAGAFDDALREAFGSRRGWEKDFRATAAMRGIGWVVLYVDPATGRMANAWVNEHDAGHWTGARPLLVFDAFEHAYMLDYGVKKDGYIESFLKAVDWREVEERFPPVSETRWAPSLAAAD